GKPLGVWKSLPVTKGDKITAKTFATYQNNQNTNSSFSLFPFVLANPLYGNTTAGNETVTTPFNASNLLVGVGIVPRSNESNQNAVPHAYLRLVHYNETNQIVGEEVRPLVVQVARADYLGKFPLRIVAVAEGGAFELVREAEFTGPDAALLREDSQ
ncbi:MAG: hypothetical protein EAZ36_04270, partial [Verrucomicrobia bacterium]